MKTSKEMAAEIASAGSEYVTYGESDLGIPVKRMDAIADILSLDDVGEGTWEECDENGELL
jgi:hypothetical protein